MNTPLHPTPDDPHAGRPIERAGTPLGSARVAVVMVHGRGASAGSILMLSQPLATDGVAFLAPEASGGTWYPYGFMSPIAANEPGITSGMRAIERTIALAADAGIPAERTVLLGFSQGACLASEYAARNARRYAGVAALSGGLIGPDDTPRDYAGTMSGTPVFLGCSDIDGHIPATRVGETAEAFTRLGAAVDMRIYPGMGHLVNDDEIDAVRAILQSALAV